MTTEPLPVQLYQRGYTDLVSVIPPRAPLTPGSKIPPSGLGKTPGRKGSTGTWAGYDWLHYGPTVDDVRRWSRDGANIGILGAGYPAIDIDSLDPWLSDEVAAIAERTVGPAPRRTGRAPKTLLMYRLEGSPFGRMAIIIRGPNDTEHLVEILGSGRQYLIYGTHPSGVAYQWNRDLPPPSELTPITAEKATAFLDTVAESISAIPGYAVERIGDGRIRTGVTVNQDSLKAPSLEVLAEAVTLIPNTNDLFPDRDDYVRIGYAIKASAQDDEEAGYEIFLEWAGRWEGNKEHPSGNTPEGVRSDWRRMHPPYTIGWSWLAALARRFGFDDSATEFVPTAPPLIKREEPPYLSDRWLADAVIDRHGDELRFVSAEGRWYVWHGGRWTPDAVRLADHLIGETMEHVGSKLIRTGLSPDDPQAKKNIVEARRINSAYTRSAVRQIVETDPRISIKAESFDTDPDLLNTPAGIVDLRTGQIRPHDPAALSSKQTKVAPDFSTPAPEWKRFLIEATGADVSMIRYLQRVAGYALTGSVREQTFWVIWGPGGNGKSVFINAIAGIMGDYARTAPMDAFTASNNDRHPTDLAMLMGARLVTATETQAGKRWDEARMKSLTGGDMVTARFMRQDFFTYVPQFKLIFVGNYQPDIRDVDAAMRRRIQIVPFTSVPKVVDPDLPAKLRNEWPAILAWMIEGAVRWQQDGLRAPDRVKAATLEYFEEQDAVSRWIDEALEPSEGFLTNEEAFESWREWAGRNGEWVGTTRRIAAALARKGFTRGKSKDGKQRGFHGLTAKTVF